MLKRAFNVTLDVNLSTSKKNLRINALLNKLALNNLKQQLLKKLTLKAV
jgi:hypothetical protein